MKIGILGGTFNPPHLGHLILAETVMEKLKLDKVVFIPANIPPLKGKGLLPDGETRWQMVKLLIDGNRHFEASRIEIEKSGVSYTFETVRILKKFYGESVQLFFIAGADVLKKIHLWKNIDEIFKLSQFVVVTRKNFKIPSSLSRNIRILKMNTVEISSTEIRRRIRYGRSIRYLVPEQVRNFILRKKLYLESVT